MTAEAVAAPANRNGVLGVTGIRHAGTNGFSNLGPGRGHRRTGRQLRQPSSRAPCLFPITAAVNAGTTTPGASIDHHVREH